MTNSKNTSLADLVPPKTRIRLVVVWLMVGLFAAYGSPALHDTMSYTVASVAFAILLFTIVGSAFGVVAEADKLADKLGEPYGTLILTLSIVAIEVILISAVMMGPGENPTIGKDSIFSVMMIIMNLVTGLCILLGGIKYGEQEYNAQGMFSYLGMVVLLGGIGMILPNFSEGAGNGMFSVTQTLVLSLVIIALYTAFLYQQLTGYRHLYIQPGRGLMEIPFSERHSPQILPVGTSAKTNKRNKNETLIRSFVLIGMIVPIVLLSHHMAVVVDFGVKAARLPVSLGGVLIAMIVFTPESMTAVKAALRNEFQRTVNLCHGAFVSTVGLTVPSVLAIGLIKEKTVLFGLTATEMTLFILTLLLSFITFSGRRTTPIMGIMHLALFVVFIMLIFSP